MAACYRAGRGIPESPAQQVIVPLCSSLCYSPLRRVVVVGASPDFTSATNSKICTWLLAHAARNMLRAKFSASSKLVCQVRWLPCSVTNAARFFSSVMAWLLLLDGDAVAKDRDLASAIGEGFAVQHLKSRFKRYPSA